jgi:hypothetical protein
MKVKHFEMASGVQCETGGRVRTDVSSFFSSASNDKVDDTAAALFAKSVGRGVYVYERSKKKEDGKMERGGGKRNKKQKQEPKKGVGWGSKNKKQKQKHKQKLKYKKQR